MASNCRVTLVYNTGDGQYAPRSRKSSMIHAGVPGALLYPKSQVPLGLSRNARPWPCTAMRPLADEHARDRRERRYPERKLIEPDVTALRALHLLLLRDRVARERIHGRGPVRLAIALLLCLRDLLVIPPGEIRALGVAQHPEDLLTRVPSCVCVHKISHKICLVGIWCLPSSSLSKSVRSGAEESAVAKNPTMRLAGYGYETVSEALVR